MEKSFTLRVDVESSKGIKEGIPKLLDLLKEKGVRASFYLVMGGESNIFELIRNRGQKEAMGERSIKVFGIFDKLRMVLFPKDFVSANKAILQRIIDEGHELGLHGWKHREWTRGLEKMDVEKTVLLAKNKYFETFAVAPVSFAAPGFNTNAKVLNALEKRGIKFMSDYPGKSVATYGKIKNVPMTITGEKNTPIIEYLVGLGKTDEEILSVLKTEILAKDIASIYIHDLYEARFKIELIGSVLDFVKEQGIKIKRVVDY